jgi:hypothetical protein
MILLLQQSCSIIKNKIDGIRYKKQTESNEDRIMLNMKSFLYKLHKRKNLKKKRISYHLDSAGEYKSTLEQVIIDEQIQYGYIVINRSYISALDMEQDIINNESTLQGVDIVIVAKREGLSIVLKAIAIENENLLSMDVIKLKRGGSSMSYIVSDELLKYYDAIKYCKKNNKNIPSENDVHIVEEKNILFWTTQYTKNSNMAKVYTPRESKFFEAFRSDTFDVVCVSK